MRICICGNNRQEAVKKIENIYGAESINLDFPGMEDNEYKLFHYAAETFKYFNKKSVVFDGGVFDVIKTYSDTGWSDLQEQVILSVINNLDTIVIITEGMDSKTIDTCKSYADFYPNKFVIIADQNELYIK